MKVKVASKVYEMNQKEFKGLLDIAREQVPFGIYAIVRKDYAELCVDHCKSITQLKSLKRQFRAQGYRVYSNGGD